MEYMFQVCDFLDLHSVCDKLLSDKVILFTRSFSLASVVITASIRN